ncbi:MAG: hypothetical protein ACI841_004375 [Planctomycetota bacterium]
MVCETIFALAEKLSDATVQLAATEIVQIKEMLRMAQTYLPTIQDDPLVRPERIAELLAQIESLLQTH